MSDTARHAADAEAPAEHVRPEIVIDLGVYADGRRLPDEPSLRDAIRAARDAGGFVWLGLANPTEAEVVEVAHELDLPELAVEDAVTAHQRPKLEVYGDQVFVVLRPVRYVDRREVVDVAEVALFLGPGFVVTVRHGHNDVMQRVRRELDAPSSELLAFGPAGVLYRAADLVVDDYESVVTDLDVDVDEIEDEVFGPDEEDHSQRIYRLKEEVASFRRAIAGLARPLELLTAGRVPQVTAGAAEYFRDVHDHVIRAQESIDVIDRQLTDVLEANTARVTMVQNRIGLQQNSDMRKISAWAAMALVPTLIAGIYGMNVRNLPGADSSAGFVVVLAVMVTACVGLYTAFRHNGWL
ncbi:magnesium and cobalt transport protein CorA [Isoptericola sp. b441]|uniref:Magnesium and cobalt transport protein CorA n=1 Tax=Actinotalea lenta TaxID=3064654 RepID=A0ABT9D7R2_9CELL|nr:MULTISPECIES: magnesium and cobalt transport protein CorA [unclassified Isoptericola]MDO8106148.1 magnesium and cobalt transport protein CorA [Isoptericola sp. b441]MDO8122133.1 magnesium and cobalt transport protein CorA [Isoptericola sp. b490]